MAGYFKYTVAIWTPHIECRQDETAMLRVSSRWKEIAHVFPDQWIQDAIEGAAVEGESRGVIAIGTPFVNECPALHLQAGTRRIHDIDEPGLRGEAIDLLRAHARAKSEPRCGLPKAS
jgi:hypothetical protein